MSQTRYHVNPATGSVGLCRAFYECPFGDFETAHFDSKKNAQRFFESTQDTFPSTSKKVSIYRVGSLEPPTTYFPDLDRIVERMDEGVPEGRQGRRGAIYASSDLESHARWILGVSSTQREQSHELRVNPESVYVYPINLYEDASAAESMGRTEEFERLRKEYWESGITLAEWRKWAIKAKPKSGEWEILLSPNDFTGSKPVSSRRIIENAPENLASLVNWALEPRRATKGLIWRKEIPNIETFTGDRNDENTSE